MIKYAVEDEFCRTKILLNYFGEKNDCDCGTCDICIEKNKGRLTTKLFKNIYNDIIELLKEGDLPGEEVIKRLNHDDSHITEVIRFLLDEDYLIEKDGKLYKKH